MEKIRLLVCSFVVFVLTISIALAVLQNVQVNVIAGSIDIYSPIKPIYQENNIPVNFSVLSGNDSIIQIQ